MHIDAHARQHYVAISAQMLNWWRSVKNQRGVYKVTTVSGSKPPDPDLGKTTDTQTRFETILASVSDGVFAVDSSWRLTCFNRAASETLGIPREQALGRPCHEVISANICPDACALRYTMETGQPIVDMLIHMQDINGRRVPATISTALIRDAAGRIVGGVETFRNLNLVKRVLSQVEQTDPFMDFVSCDPAVKQIFDILPTIAQSYGTVLIRGATGTGKSLIAGIIHRLSKRREKPLVTVNCGALPETLLESELFGYRAGAFTGAVRDHPGRIASASGGTLFLDEIGDLPLATQIKLLRFLQDRVYERLGDVKPRQADVRVLTATTQNLERMIEAGSFRRDLYYRINVLSMEIPPLIDRPGDIAMLVQHFIDKYSTRNEKRVIGIDDEAMGILRRYGYPGNVRELENAIESACVLCVGPEITPADLPVDLCQSVQSSSAVPADSLADNEAQFILKVLQRNGWHRGKAASELGLHRSTLMRRIHRLGITLPEVDGRTHDQGQ